MNKGDIFTYQGKQYIFSHDSRRAGYFFAQLYMCPNIKMKQIAYADIAA